MGQRLANGFAAQRSVIIGQITAMARDVRAIVQLHSPAKKGPWSEQGGPIRLVISRQECAT